MKLYQTLVAVILIGSLPSLTNGQNIFWKAKQKLAGITNTGNQVTGTISEVDTTLRTINESRQAAKSMMEAIGLGKDTANIRVITIENAEFESPEATSLLASIKVQQGIKAIRSEFADGRIYIVLNSKKTLGAIWEAIPENIQDDFTSLENNDRSMKIRPKSAEKIVTKPVSTIKPKTSAKPAVKKAAAPVAKAPVKTVH